MMGGMGMGGAFAWIFPMIMVIVMVAMVGSSILFVRRGKPELRRRHSPRPLDVLKERYARGEIDREEYLERRVLLEGDEDREEPD